MLKLHSRSFVSECLRSAHSAAAKPGGVHERYAFEPLEEKHIDSVAKYAAQRFFAHEPHCKALKLIEHPKHCLTIMEGMVKKSVKHPYSYRVLHKETGELVGYRLMSVYDRSAGNQEEDFDFEFPIPESIIQMGETLEEMRDRFWKLVDPTVTKVIHREMTFVEPQHQRQGIAQHLLHKGLDFDLLKSAGFHGIYSDSSSIANQTLLSRNGYKCVYEHPTKFPLADGTKSIKCMFKDIR